jgi:sporulation protein YqfC
MKKLKKIKDKKMSLSNILEVPKDVVLGEAIITLIGKREAIIENYKGIVKYEVDYVKVSTKNGVIEFKGLNFNITYLTNEEIKITGDIHEIIY